MSVKQGRKMRILRSILVILLLSGGIFAFLPGGKVYAEQGQPDGYPSAEFHVYRNLLETGDFLLFIYANIPYTSTPDALVNEAFIWRLIDTDGVTELGQTVGYPFNDNGYGYNVYSMYFPAADNLTWGAAYNVRLSENPAVFTSPTFFDYVISPADYTAFTATADVQTELASRILITAADLDVRWGLTTSTTLLNELETGTILSMNGQAFFRGAIYGIQGLAPGVFEFIVGQIDADPRTWDTAFADNLSTQYAGTWVETAKQAGADLWGKGYDLSSVIFAMVVFICLVLANIYIAKSFWSGMVDGAWWLVVAAALYLYDPAFAALVAGLLALYSSAKVWGLVR